MPYYLAPYIGTGTMFDPFRPFGSDQPGWSAIDLRPDAGATLGGGGLNACFLHLPIANPDPQLRLVALAPTDTIGPALKVAIRTRLNLPTSPVSTRWDDLVLELLIGPPPGGWQALRPTVDRQLEVWLGGLLKRVPSISGGSSIADTFDRANGDLNLSTSSDGQFTWDELQGTNWNVLSNQADIAVDAGTPDGRARAQFDLATDDHYCEATISAITTGTGVLTVEVLFRKDSTSTMTFYYWEARLDLAVYRLYKVVNNMDYTQLGADSTPAPAVNDVMRGDANGSTIRGLVGGGERVSVTDSQITDNLRCGIRGYNDTAGQVGRLNNWSAADLVAGGGATWPGWVQSRGGWW